MSTIAKVRLKSISPFSFSNYVSEPKLPKELAKDYEERTWRERCHYDRKTGECFIPPMMFNNAIKEAAKYLSLPIPGQGKATYTKNFDSSVLITDWVMLGVSKDDIEGERLFLPSDGRVGGTTRVEKIMPVVLKWEGQIDVNIFDDIITQDVFKKVIDAAGSLIGVGRFRPRKRGYYGRFTSEVLSWQKL